MDYVFRPQNFWGEGPPKSDADAPMGTHQESLVQLPQQIPTISARVHQIFGQFMASEVCISKRWSSSTNCEIFRGGRQRPLAPEILASEILIECVDQSSPNLVARRGVIAVSNAVFRSTISCSRPEIPYSRSNPEVQNLAKILMFLGFQIFF